MAGKRDELSQSMPALTRSASPVISSKMQAVHRAINQHGAAKKQTLLEEVEAKRLLVQQLDPSVRQTKAGILQVHRECGRIELSDTFPDQTHLIPGSAFVCRTEGSNC